MSELSTATALVTLAQSLTGWEWWGALCAVIIGPWLACVYMAMRLTATINALKDQLHDNRAADQERFNSVAQFYKDNVLLVEGYQRISENQSDTIERNTVAITRLVDRIDSNHFCPAVRKRGTPDG